MDWWLASNTTISVAVMGSTPDGFYFESDTNCRKAVQSVDYEHNSTGVNEGIKCQILLKMKCRARPIVGRGGKSLQSDSGFGLRVGGSRINRAHIVYRMRKNNESNRFCHVRAKESRLLGKSPRMLQRPCNNTTTGSNHRPLCCRNSLRALLETLGR